MRKCLCSLDLRQQNKQNKGVDNCDECEYNRGMKENENLLDLYNAMLEAQEADQEARGLMDAPDSFQISGIKEEDLCGLCDSANTYLSEATPYNTVRVCKDCGHEEHTPFATTN